MKNIIFALVAGATALSASAQTISKPYIGLGVTTAQHQLKADGVTRTEGGDRQAAAKIFAGADITQNFGVEVGHSASGDEHRASVAGLSGDVDTRSRRTYLAGKATMPVNEQFSLYGKLGVVHTKDKVSATGINLSHSESDNGVYAGVGGQFNLNEKVALTLEYERNGKKRDFGAKADAVSVGARYSF